MSPTAAATATTTCVTVLILIEACKSSISPSYTALSCDGPSPPGSGRGCAARKSFTTWFRIKLGRTVSLDIITTFDRGCLDDRSVDRVGKYGRAFKLNSDSSQFTP